MKLRKQCHLHKHQKRIKYLRIKLAKVQDLYTINCKTLKKKINEDANKYKDISSSWTAKT